MKIPATLKFPNVKTNKTILIWWMTVALLWGALGLAKARADSIHILYDSQTDNPELKAGWGFSAAVTAGKLKVLVDTGWEPEILRHNLKVLGYSPADFDLLVITHWHPDHAGGLRYLFSRNPDIKAYVPSDIPDYYPDYSFHTVKKYKKINPSLYIFQTNPTNPRFHIKEELSLVVKTARGPVIISGCFHTGWPQLIKDVSSVFPEKPYLMVGGGRFVDLNREQLVSLATEIKGLGLQRVGLSHCAAGRIPESVFQKFFPGKSVYARLGALIDLP